MTNQQQQPPLPTTEAECIALLNTALHRYKKSFPPSNFDNAFMRAVTCTAARLETATSPPEATYHFAIPDTYVNMPQTGTIHGGAIATFFDILTSPVLMLATTNRWENAGQTRCLNVTYFKAPVKGEGVVMQTFGTSIGKRSATVRGELRRERDGVLLAMCSHEKVLADRKEYYKL